MNGANRIGQWVPRAGELPSTDEVAEVRLRDQLSAMERDIERKRRTERAREACKALREKIRQLGGDPVA